MNKDIERGKVEDVNIENRETTSVYGRGGRRDPGGRPGNNNAGESDTKSTPNAANTEETDVSANADRADPAAQALQGSSKVDSALRLPSRSELRNLWLKEYGEQDYALQMWTRVVEQQDLEIEMMLQMHGMLIFGLMVSTQRYAQFYIDLNEELHRENEPETADALRDYYTALTSELRQRNNNGCDLSRSHSRVPAGVPCCGNGTCYGLTCTNVPIGAQLYSQAAAFSGIVMQPWVPVCQP